MIVSRVQHATKEDDQDQIVGRDRLLEPGTQTSSSPRSASLGAIMPSGSLFPASAAAWNAVLTRADVAMRGEQHADVESHRVAGCECPVQAVPQGAEIAEVGARVFGA